MKALDTYFRRRKLELLFGKSRNSSDVDEWKYVLNMWNILDKVSSHAFKLKGIPMGSHGNRKEVYITAV